MVSVPVADTALIVKLGPPPPPEVGSTNHFSVELVWEEALKNANHVGKGQGLVKICLQQKNDAVGRSNSWTNCYKSVDITKLLLYVFVLSVCRTYRPDATFALDWVLKASYL